jgi:hypothetical protein
MIIAQFSQDSSGLIIYYGFCRLLSKIGTRVYFAIDGLDEYKSNLAHVVSWLSELP